MQNRWARKKSALKRAAIVTILGFFTLAMIGTACKRFHHKTPEERAEWIVKKLTNHLELDAKQQKTVTRIKKEFLIKQKLMLNSRNAMHQIVLEEIQNDTVNKGRLQTAFKKRHASRGEMQEFILEKFIEFHAVLRPLQRKKLAQKLGKIHKKHLDGR